MKCTRFYLIFTPAYSSPVCLVCVFIGRDPLSPGYRCFCGVFLCLVMPGQQPLVASLKHHRPPYWIINQWRFAIFQNLSGSCVLSCSPNYPRNPLPSTGSKFPGLVEGTFSTLASPTMSPKAQIVALEAVWLDFNTQTCTCITTRNNGMTTHVLVLGCHVNRDAARQSKLKLIKHSLKQVSTMKHVPQSIKDTLLGDMSKLVPFCHTWRPWCTNVNIYNFFSTWRC